METRQGILYGVGVGPGDPELLTIKALRTLERCPVIAAPQTKSGEMLARDKSRQHSAHEAAADAVAQHLQAGRDVAMLNLGDVSIYATFGYIMDILRRRGYAVVMVPGVPSFCAAAARLGITLVRGETPLHIAPATGPIEPMLALPGAKVLMKAGRRLPEVRAALEQTEEFAALVENCGLPGETIYSDLRQAPESVGYFATAIVKER